MSSTPKFRWTLKVGDYPFMACQELNPIMEFLYASQVWTPDKSRIDLEAEVLEKPITEVVLRAPNGAYTVWTIEASKL